MKKTILIVCTAFVIFSLTAFAYSNVDIEVEKEITTNEPPTFAYDVDSRFFANITKEDLFKANTIIDLVPKESGWDTKTFRRVKINILTDGENPFAKGESNELTAEQKRLLQSADYSTNFNIEANCNRTFPETGETKDQCFIYYITVIPEKEASYMGGKEAIINYLKENCESTIAKIERGNLKPGKAHFTISKEGTIKNVNLESTSGYPTVDKKMMELISTMPGEWIPATNENGEHVEQELVFSFGTVGC